MTLVYLPPKFPYREHEVVKGQEKDLGLHGEGSELSHVSRLKRAKVLHRVAGSWEVETGEAILWLEESFCYTKASPA